MTTPDLISKLREAWVGTDDYTSILIMLAADRLEELTEWIDFDDHYPELGETVLIKTADGSVTTGYRVEYTDELGKSDGMVTDDTRPNLNLTHWRAI